MADGWRIRRRWRRELSAPATRQAALTRLRTELDDLFRPLVTRRVPAGSARAASVRWAALEPGLRRQVRATAHGRTGVFAAAEGVLEAVNDMVEDLLRQWRAEHVGGEPQNAGRR